MKLHHNYYVYILTNANKTTLYIGITNNLVRRILEHREDANNKRKTFAGKYKCVHLVYWEHYQYINIAIEREKQLKKWRREKKENLINEFNPTWSFYSLDELD